MGPRLPAGLLSGLALLASPPVAAHQPQPPARYHATWWTVDDGLPGNWIPDITEDGAGRIWVIAGGILARFDGRDFEIVDLVDSAPVTTPADVAIAIERGAGDTLWASTDHGRILIHSRGRWAPVYQADGRVGELVVRAGLPPVGREAEGPGFYLWQDGRRVTGPQTGPSVGLEHPSIALDAAGLLWAVDRDGTTASVLAADQPRSLEVATGRFVVSGAGEGPLGVRRRAGRLEIIDVTGAVRISIPDGEGRVPRLLTRDGRVVATTPTAVEIFEGAGAPARFVLDGGGPVQAVFEDRRGGLWLGTEHSGLMEVRRAPFEVFSPGAAATEGTPIRTVQHGRDGSVLLVGDGLWRVRGARVEPVGLRAFPPATRIATALEDDAGALWLSLLGPDDVPMVAVRSPDGGIRRFDLTSAALVFEPTAGAMFWLTDTGYCRLPSEADAAPVCTALPGWGPHDMLVARDGTLWIAGRQGVRAERDGRVRSYTPAEGYPLARARALHEDEDGAIWIGTYFGGLGRLEGDSLRIIRRRDGLAEDVVSAILEDDAGTLWMSGNRGIHSLSKASASAFLAGEVSRVAGRAFGRRDGLTNAEASGWQGVAGRDGRLWFPTFGGAVALPRSPAGEIAPDPIRVTFDRIASGDSAFAATDSVRLPRGARHVEIDVAAVDVHAPGATLVEYLLEGRTAGWAPVPDGRTMTLAGLRPGAHRLQVRALSPDHPETPSMAEVVLVVPPIFTETPWFALLVAALLAGFIAVFVRLRTRFLQRRAAELAIEVREQTHWLEVERDRTAAALEKVAERGVQLRDLLLTKSRMFAGLSHELRTPMSLLLAPLRELERDADSAFPPEARGHLGVLSVAARRLERLTAQFLDLADSQSGTLRLQRRTVDAGAFLAECIERMRPVADRARVRLSLDVRPRDPVRAELDPDHLDKVVGNLVENAIRHAPEGGSVSVVLQPVEEEALVFEVHDDGSGVPAEIRDRIFEPFVQAPDADGGMGLGLAMCRDVVLLHGGRIALTSPPGAGATFRVTLPLVGGPDGVQRTASPPDDRSEAASSKADPATAAVAGPRDRILVVEDDAEMRSFLAGQFQQRYEVRTAPGGDEGLATVRGWLPHLVISDVMMPGLDGLGLCRILKADPATRTLPVILLTALGDREHQLQGLASGADAYVAKPFDMEELQLRVANLLRLRRGIEDRFQSALPAWASILYRSGAERIDARSEKFLERFYRTLVDGLENGDLDVDGIAKQLHMSRSSLYRRVRELLDCSPLDVLMEVRLEQAALYLRTTGDAVSTIASRVGFRSAEQFSRRFVAHFGLSPRAYRTQAQAADG